VRGNAVFIVLMALGATLLVSDALDAQRHRTVNLVIVAIMFCGAALDLAWWIRRRRAENALGKRA
jgi:membrane protein DedA with SNARE-associated domain